MSRAPRRRDRALAVAFAACLLFCFVGTVHGRTSDPPGRSTRAAGGTAVHGVTEVRLVDTGEADPASIADPVVFVTRTGERYHRGGCRYLRASCSPLRLGEAKATGYTPCLRCRPPE
jgi:hypothetical protein